MAIEAYNNNESIVRRYIDSADVKEYISNVLVPKYFPRIPISGLKIGEIGLISEYMSDIVEDGSYATALALNEAFITRSILDESIYASAATFDLGYEYAIPAAVPVMLEVHYDDILNHAVDRQIYIDRDTKIQINGYEYVLDYDIRLTYTYIGGRIRFTAAYDMRTYNPVSKAVTPYIPCQVKDKWVCLFVTAREYRRTYQTETVTDNLMFTAAPMDLSFQNMICGLTGYYRYNGENVLMTNKVKYSIPIAAPFFFHRLKEENIIEISFSAGKKYWRPDFNSQIDFTIYTTNGDKGNFEISSDQEATVVRTGERYIYNEDIRMVAIPYNASVGGLDQPDIEMVRQDTIQAFNTAHVLMTDDDISLYFETYAKRYDTVAKFFKRRDDPTGRLFGMFNLIHKDGYIYETLTAKCIFWTNTESSTNALVNGINGAFTNRYNTITLYSGDTWRYWDAAEEELDRHTQLVLQRDNIRDITSVDDETKIFVNPFIMKINKYPGLITYYNPLVNYTGLLRQDRYETGAIDHFIGERITVYRGIGENSYKIRVLIIPSTNESEYNEFDENKRFKYNYFSNPDDTYHISFIDAGINSANVNTNNGELEILNNGEPNPAYRRSLTEYIRETYKVFPQDGCTIYNTDIVHTSADGFSGKYVYNRLKEFIRVVPTEFPLRVVLSAESNIESVYTEMYCVGDYNGSYMFEAELKTENDIMIDNGREVVGIILGDDPYEAKAIGTSTAGKTYISSTNTKIHIYAIYKSVLSEDMTIDPQKDKKFSFSAEEGTPPITMAVRMNTEVFDMRLNAIVEQLQLNDPTKQQGSFTTDFYVKNIDDNQKYRWRSDATPQWQFTNDTPANNSYLFEFSFNNPPSLTSSDPIVFSHNISAAYACLPFPDNTYRAEIEDEATALNKDDGSTYQYIKSSNRWLLLGSPSLFSDPDFRGWNITDTFINDYDNFDILEQWSQMRSTVVFNGNATGYRIDVGLVPLLRYDLCKDDAKVRFIIKTMNEQYKQMSQLVSDRLEENTGIDFKLYNTCGRGVFYKIGVDSAENPRWTMLDSVSIRIKFILGVKEEVLYQDTMEAVQDHIKHYIENLDIDEATIFNVSNLQTSIETNVSNVRYLIFLGINDYDSTYQRIKLDDPYKIDMSMYEFQIYVPEFLTINKKNITIIRGE